MRRMKREHYYNRTLFGNSIKLEKSSKGAVSRVGSFISFILVGISFIDSLFNLVSLRNCFTP
jgi:hypothetical protein